MATGESRRFLCFLLTLTICLVSPAPRSCHLFCQCFHEGKTSWEIHAHCESQLIPKLFTNVTYATFTIGLLSSVEDFAFEEAPFLRKVWLFADNLVHISEDAFQGLKYLQLISIASKKKVRIDAGAFANSDNVERIKLKAGLQHIPKQVCRATKLQWLHLDENSITSAMFPLCTENLTNLHTIDLSQNPLKTLESRHFYHLRNINISGLIASECELTALPNDLFFYLPVLKVLNVARNKIAVLPQGIFAKLKYLAQIEVSNTMLHGTPLESNPPFIDKLVLLDLSHIKTMNMSFGEQFQNATRLQQLTLSYSKVGNLTDSTFSSFTESPLTSLHLVHADIVNVTTGSLKPFTNLLELYLDDNPIREEALRNISIAVSGPLKRLSLRSSRVREIDNTTFKGFIVNSSLTFLDLKRCEPHFQIRSNAFHVFRNLRTLILESCSLTLDSLDRNALAGLDSLQRIDLSQNNFHSIPSIQKVGRLPSLLYMDLSHNAISVLKKGDFYGYEGLVGLKLMYNNIRVVVDISEELPNLEKLELQDNSLSVIKVGAFRAMKKLTLLRLDRNRIVDVAHPDLSFPATVRKLHLGANANLGRSTKLDRMLSGMPELQTLYLASCNVLELPKKMFNNNSALTSLQLSHNFISTWDPVVFRPLSALEELYLKFNRITTVNETSFIYLVSLKVLDLAENPLACTCDLVWFKHWLSNVELYLFEYYRKESYTCYSPNDLKGVSLRNFTLSPVDCSSKKEVHLIIALPSSVVFACALATFVYRYRWYLSYYVFLLRYRRRQRRNVLVDADAFQFDVYVCYHNSARRWVIEHLVPNLEDNGGLKLCLHDRDWFPGRTILDNVVESIESSRKILLVVNGEFARSDWCRRETTLAYQRLVEEQNNLLVVVLLEDVHQEYTNRTLRSLLASRTYLAWTDGGNREARFWKTLRRTLRNIEHPTAGIEMHRA